MPKVRMLTPQEAEGVVEDRLEFFGLGALPEVRVRAVPNGRWRVWWTDRGGYARVSDVRAMNHGQWYDWLEQNVGPMSPELLATTEG